MSFNSARYQSVTEDLSRERDVSASGREGFPGLR